MAPRVFRDHPGFATIQEAMAATPSERVESIGRFIEKQVARFQATLKARERANCGCDDTISELTVRLLEKDGEWNPERGRYITFAAKIIERELYSVREKARVVPSPRNSSGRMREYTAEEKAGTITPRRSKTANDIRRTTACAASLSHAFRDLNDDFGLQVEDRRGLSPTEAAEENEATTDAFAALRSAIVTLPPFEAFVLGHLAGLWGRRKKSVFQVAWETRADEAEIRKAWARAVSMIRAHLSAKGYSLTA